MNFTQLKYFIAVAHYGSMTKAAEELHIEQSALSKVIRRLEDEINVNLFNRKGRAIVLNDSGQAFLEFAEQCVNSYQKVSHTISQGNRDYYGQLTIAMSIKSSRVYEILEEFHRFWPNVHLTIKHTKSTEAAFDCDFIFGMSDYETAYLKSAFRSTGLWRESTCLMISEKNPLSRRESIRLNEASELPFILSLDQEFSVFSDKLFRLANFTPISMLKVDDPNLVAHMVQANLAVALNPEFTPFCHSIAGIHMLPISVPEYYRHIFLFSAPYKENSRVRKMFYEFATDYCSRW